MRVRLTVALGCVLLGAAVAVSLAGQESGTREHPVRVGRDVPPLKRIKVVAPSFPADAEKGTTILELTVSPSGDVDRVDVMMAVKGASDAAVEAARQWVFEPLVRDERAVWAVTAVSVPNPWPADR